MDYRELLLSAMQNPEVADFRALRLAYAESPGYDPYDPPADVEESVSRALTEGDVQGAVQAIRRELEADYLDIVTHSMAALAYKRAGDDANAAFHMTFASGLVQSILDSGDGLSFSTAFVVIDVGEEYAVLRVLRLQPLAQSLHADGQHQFDVIECVNSETGKKLEIFFNVDIPMRYLQSIGGRQGEGWGSGLNK